MKTIEILFIGFIILFTSCTKNSEEITKKGKEFYNDKKYNKAIAEFDKAIKINEDDKDAHFYRGFSFFHQDLFDKAIPDFDKVIMLDNNSFETFFARGVSNLQLGNYEKAINDISYFIDVNSYNKEAFYLRGVAYDAINKYEKAIKDFNRTIELDSTDSEAYLIIGKLKYENISKNEGCQYIAKAMQMGNKNAEDYYYSNCVTYFDIDLVKIWNEYSLANIALELKNRFGKHIDKLWLQAELRTKKGDYLAGKKNIHYSNIRPDAVSVEEVSWRNTDFSDIGEIILTPYLLEIEGTNYKFETQYFNIFENKFDIKVTF